jgi:hypothetical protein
LCGAVYGCEFFGVEEFGEDEEYAVGGVRAVENRGLEESGCMRKAREG